MLGIIIGVAAVIVIMALGNGAQSLILDQIKNVGSDKIGVLPGKADDNGPPASVMGITITTLTLEDALAMADKKNIPNIAGVVAYVNGSEIASWRDNSYRTNIRGVSSDYLAVEGGELENGIFFTSREGDDLARVAVLGDTAKKEIFGDSEAVGQKIKIKKHVFEVAGVMKKRGQVAFQDMDDQILIPIKTMQKSISGINYINMLRAKVDNEENVDQALEDTKLLLRERHDISDPSGDSDDFSARSGAQALDVFKTITDALKFFLAAMAALSLIVGGIGIMNIMLVAVTERTREIGLRKAIGATNYKIIIQFLLETIIITTGGGIVGLILGLIVSYLAAIIIRHLGYSWDFSISILSVILAIGVSASIGLIFGIYPASKASRLDPVEALRYE